MSLPVLVGSLSSLDFLIDFELVVMVLKVTASDYVVVSQPRSSGLLDLLLLFKGKFCGFYLLFLLWRALFGRVKVVLSHWDVTQDVVVDVRVLARSEVPGLVFRIVGVAFQALQLVVEVHDVEGLLVPEGSVLGDEGF